MSGIKDFVYQRAEGELINRIFNATSAQNILVHGRLVAKTVRSTKFSSVQLSSVLSLPAVD